MPPEDDSDLLARLNALRPSSVTLREEQNVVPSVEVEVETHRASSNVEDALAERLRALRCNSEAAPSRSTIGGNTGTKASLRNDRPDLLADDDQPEPDLDLLLAEIGPDDQWQLDPEDPAMIQSLIREAKHALPDKNRQSANVPSGDDQPEEDTSHGTAAADAPAIASQAHGPSPHANPQDEQEADAYVQRILAELQHDRLNGTPTPDDDCDPPSLAAAALPAVPTDQPLKDNAMQRHLDLPSTPQTPPRNSPSTTTRRTPDARPRYTDADVDTWCCICNEDGEVRCLGCDGDIYCRECWRQGHGDGPGQEKGHRAVQYNRKPSGLATATV